MPRYKGLSKEVSRDSDVGLASCSGRGRLGRWFRRAVVGLGMLATTMAVEPASDAGFWDLELPQSIEDVVVPDASKGDFLERFFLFFDPLCRRPADVCNLDSHVRSVVRGYAGSSEYALQVRDSRWIKRINATAGDGRITVYKHLMESMYWTAAGIEAKRLALREGREFSLSAYMEDAIWEVKDKGRVVNPPIGHDRLDDKDVRRSFHSMQAVLLGHEVSHIINGDSGEHRDLYHSLDNASDFSDYMMKAEYVERMSLDFESRADRFGLDIVLSELETVVTAVPSSVLDRRGWESECRDRCSEYCGWDFRVSERNSFDPVAALGVLKIIEVSDGADMPKQVFRTHPDSRDRFEAARSYVLESDWAEEHPEKEVLPDIIDELYR